MAAARLNMEVPKNGTWRKVIRHKQRAPTRQDPNAKAPTDLTGYNAKLQAKDAPGGTLLFTISTRSGDHPQATIPVLDATGVISWALDVSLLSLPSTAVYELILIDPGGLPDPLLEGQLQFTTGITTP